MSGVSKSTVSRVINNDRYVSDDLRKKSNPLLKRRTMW
ncbi:LacI family DNA-binding transcriptional regulator [Enterococcus mundtii]|nr:LacI family DNA-binding transcriptional regulator [Enterococcus mundtii]